MIRILENKQHKLSLVFELSFDGTVLYFRNTARTFSGDSNFSPVGQNFFEMKLFENAPALQRRFNDFLKRHDAVENFNFTLNVENDLLPTRVMMMRVVERSNNERAQSIIVDIRSV